MERQGRKGKIAINFHKEVYTLDMSNFWSITGTIATIIFGFLSIYLVIKRRYPGKITYITEECINLFEALVKNFEEISIKYKYQPIHENIVYLRGIFLNTGDTDIKPDMVEENLSIILPEGYKWLTAKITKASSLNQNLIINDSNQLFLELGLFKKKEFIQFEALAEVIKENNTISSGINLKKLLAFKHRIADTGKVEIKEMVGNQRLKKNYSMIKLSCVMSIIMIFLVVLSGIVVKKSKITQLHVQTIEKNKIIESKMYPRTDGTIFLKSINSKYQETIPIQQLISSKKYKLTVAKNNFFDPLILIAVSINLLMISILMGLSYLEIYQTKKISKILRVGEPSPKIKLKRKYVIN